MQLRYFTLICVLIAGAFTTITEAHAISPRAEFWEPRVARDKPVSKPPKPSPAPKKSQKQLEIEKHLSDVKAQLTAFLFGVNYSTKPIFVDSRADIYHDEDARNERRKEIADEIKTRKSAQETLKQEMEADDDRYKDAQREYDEAEDRFTDGNIFQGNYWEIEKLKEAENRWSEEEELGAGKERRERNRQRYERNQKKLQELNEEDKFLENVDYLAQKIKQWEKELEEQKLQEQTKPQQSAESNQSTSTNPNELFRNWDKPRPERPIPRDGEKLKSGDRYILPAEHKDYLGEPPV